MCPICGGAATPKLDRLHDDRYGFRGAFDLLACNSCGHRWLDWHPDGDTLAAMYSDYYPRASRSVDEVAPPPRHPGLRGWWRGERSSAMFWVPPGARVLDIGCGFGESLAYHRMRGCEVHGVEADRNIARVAMQHGFDVHVGLFDPALYETGYFDVVTMDQVLEHVVAPVDTLRGVSRVLRPGGTAIVTTPNADSLGARVFGRRWINWHPPYHLHFFTPTSLRCAAEQAGLAVAKITTITSSEWLGYQWIHLLTAPGEGERSSLWTKRRRSLREQLTITPLRLAHRTGLDHLLTRLCDVAGVGDNFVVQLQRRDMG